MRYEVKLFALLKERVGNAKWVYECDKPLHAKALITTFFDKHGELEGLRHVTRLAVNQAFCSDDPALSPQDELALIPPVSGG